jgi:DNA invertase Pin-like site-specific DNA recombinase
MRGGYIDSIGTNRRLPRNLYTSLLGQEAASIARIAKEARLTRQTVYRIKGDPAGAEAALAAWGM